MSIAGGVDLSVDRALATGCDVMQVFTKSNNQWKARALRDDEVDRFRREVAARGLQPVVAHDSYLINVASPDAGLRRKSISALDEEVSRCERLGIPYLVMHPGSHVGSGVSAAIARIAAALDEIEERHEQGRVKILLENTAGQGTNIGHRFEELAEIFAKVRSPGRLGVCFDTAHAFAAGYDIGTAAGWDETWCEFDRTIGLGRLEAIHANDSKKPLGSRVDRHEHIGLGLIPCAAFLRLMNDPRLDGLPALLETPKTDDGFEDEQNLAVLRRLAGRKRTPGRPTIDRWRAEALDDAREAARGAGARVSVDKPKRIGPAARRGRPGRDSKGGRSKGARA